MKIMFGSTTLELALGMAFIYLMLSMLVSAIREAISACVRATINARTKVRQDTFARLRVASTKVDVRALVSAFENSVTGARPGVLEFQSSEGVFRQGTGSLSRH